ncbi:ISL3 family transposase [Oceanospirillaceae bacterium ASx5O]|nr:ISL3 family transposase [Oceanospirillaceae bacterium ASx5O]
MAVFYKKKIPAMDQLTLYDQILGLSPPWGTRSVDLNELSGEVVVTVSYDRDSSASCPVCQQPCRHYDSRARTWRHLDTCQYKTIIQADVPRVECPEHGVLTVQVPWANSSSHYTMLFELRVLKLAQENTISAVSRQLRLSWSSLDRIIQRGIKRGLNRRWELDCRHLHVDETSVNTNREYITVLSNQSGLVLAIADGRSSSSLTECLRDIPIQSISKARSLSMDMSPAYIRAANEFFGTRASKMIGFDHFHVARSLARSVDQIRKTDMKNLPSLERLHVHRNRYLWLRNGAELDVSSKDMILSHAPLMGNTIAAWTLKEKARDIWKGIEPKTRSSWKQWIKLVMNTGIKPLIAVAEMVRKHLDGIVLAMQSGHSNSRAEALNKNIKNLNRNAHGHRNQERYKAMIYLRFGNLDMSFSH